MAKEYSAKETELKAEAKVLGQKRILQTQERQAMLKAVMDVCGKLNEGECPSADYLAAKAEETEINEPTASSLDRISSKRDNQVESLQTSLDPAGHLRVTKTLQKLELPHNSESYRRVMKVEAYAWLCMSARFKAKTWLQGLKLDHFVKFVDFVLGDKVAALRLPTASGVDTTFNRPPWQVVLSFELKLRSEAMKMVIDDGSRLADALEAVTKDPSLKEAFFTTPLALHSLQSLSSPLKYHKGGKAKGFGVLLHRRATHFLGPATGNRLRSKLYLRGFPWLNNRHAAEVQASNFMIDQCLRAATLAIAAGNQFLLEHPEDLGLAPDGLIPASIWSWPELLDLLVSTQTVCFALFQCHFGAPFAKPTRLLTNLRAFLQHPPKYASLPAFDASHRYTGPLPWRFARTFDRQGLANQCLAHYTFGRVPT